MDSDKFLFHQYHKARHRLDNVKLPCPLTPLPPTMSNPTAVCRNYSGQAISNLRGMEMLVQAGAGLAV